ncbi:RNA polymerase II transcriptional coactivator KIWI isoform X1 [Cucumis melo var. makuwa]|uniref:RNA polymerase II transcriptional coactivator KIWI isoform X1 n=1 Tax=Cucumis melo var. makuwa TaxID=1194695 RepID=A0A5A7TD38_CUCMM|nr:RNA polymerase II transcriptional coactivator KIWI isoform X1 [Cucumis melo var. makuwa]
MSASGKRKDDEDRVSEGDAPPSKTFRKDPDDADEIVVCELSKNRRVMVRKWQGKIVVDIREFYVKDGKQMPGKKGCFTFVCCICLCCSFELPNDALGIVK